jgi:CBS domain-containing protein
MAAQSINEVMAHDPVTVETSSPLVDVAARMRDSDIGTVVVTENNRLKGLVTDRDIVVRAVADGRDPNQATAGDVCSTQLVTLNPQDSLDRAVQIMRGHDVRRVPVVQDERVVGIVSLGDLAMELDERSALADISAAAPNN